MESRAYRASKRKKLTFPRCGYVETGLFNTLRKMLKTQLFACGKLAPNVESVKKPLKTAGFDMENSVEYVENDVKSNFSTACLRWKTTEKTHFVKRFII